MNTTAKMNILLVDDGPENLLGLKNLLKGLDLNIFTATSGNEALEMMSEHDLGLVVFDARTPNIDGFEAVKLIKGHEKNIPIIFIAGSGEEQEKILKGAEAGVVDYLFKPLAPEIVVNKVRTFLEFHRQKRDIEQAAARIDQAEERYRLLFQNSPDAIAEFNKEGEYLTVNQAMAERFGFLPEELLGKNIFDLVPQKVARRRLKIIKRVIETKQSQIFEDEREGRFFHNILTPLNITGQQGTVQVISREITALKQTEQELQQEKAYVENIIESVPDMLFIINPASEVSYLNKTLEKFIGAESQDIVGRPVNQVIQEFKLLTPESAAIFAERVKIRLKSGERVTGVELEMINGKGETVPCTYSASEIKDPQGEVLDEVVTIRDISRLKRAEAEILRTTDRLNAIINSATGFYISTVDLKGNITSWNKGAEIIMGYTEDEVVGKMHISQLLSEEVEALKNPDKTIQELITEGSRIWELNVKKKNGEIFPALINVTPFKDEKGTLMGILVLGQDITKRKRAEEELARAKDAAELYSKDLKHTLEVSEELRADVEEAKLQAEAANEAKSEFLANMSHEIRTPMNGIIGMTGLLLDTNLAPEQRDYTETIRSSSDALLTIINDILDFSKIEAGKLDLEVLDFDLRTTVEDMNDLVAIKAYEKKIEYVCMIEPDVPALLRGDPGRLRQILVNLIGNAIKFTPQGEVNVYVSLEDEDDERAKIRFAVTDTGIGIPKDKIGSLFDSFSQADTSTTRHYGGTGLGLAISRLLAGKMGGEIRLTSQEGKGSTFWFTAVFEKRSVGREVVIELPVEVRDRRILIVDDNAANRRALTRQLNSWQYRCGEASDGESALVKLRAAYAEGDPFQAALLDMQMPGMDGEALGRKIKDDPAISDTPLVMMTSAGRRGDAVRLEDIGFSAYLTKPVKQSRLYDCLMTILSREKGSVEVQETRIVTRHSITEDRKRRVRILLAEDNLVNQKITLKILEKFGYRADAVANGLEAVKALEKLPYDVVLMDCQMPEMDGFEAARTIRDAKSAIKNHETPIIALTAHAMKGDREKCIKAGMNDYIPKPFEPRQLIEAIEQALSGRVSPPHDKASETQGKEVFDRAGLLDRILGDEELLKEVLEIYLQDTPGHIESIKEALKKNDASGVKQYGHKIKGASGMICAGGMQTLGFQVETAGKKGDLSEAVFLIEKMEREFARLKEAFSIQGLDQK